MSYRIAALLIAALALSGASAQAPPDSFVSHVVRFSRQWETFVRKMAGCPPTGVIDSISQCNAGLQTLDYTAFGRACEEAKAIWGLTGDCKRTR